MNKDLHSNIKQVLAVNAVALGTTGAITGAIIDRTGYGTVTFLPGYGSVTTTGTDVALIIKEGDTTGALTSVADTDLIGTEVLAALPAGARTAGTGKEVVKRIGYKGNKRYVQMSFNHTGTTSVGIVWGTAVLGAPHVAPVSNP